MPEYLFGQMDGQMDGQTDGQMISKAKVTDWLLAAEPTNKVTGLMGVGFTEHLNKHRYWGLVQSLEVKWIIHYDISWRLLLSA